MEERLRQLYYNSDSPDKRRWTTVEEIELISELTSGFDRVIESGTANGWSACWFAAKGSEVITFDPVARPKIWTQFPELQAKITYVQKPFAENAIDYITDDTIIFIDGDHSTSGITGDFDAVKEKGDRFVVHDSTTETPIVRFLHRLQDDKRFTQITYETKRGVTWIAKVR